MYTMSNSSVSGKNRSDYRREENEVMHAGPPLDFSFKNANAIDELVNQTLKAYRIGKFPEKSCGNHYLTSSMWLSNNQLTSVAGLEELAEHFLEKPINLRWLDLAYNKLTTVEDELTKFKRITILYLHGNNISDMKGILNLRCLKNLRSLTLHGNPIEQMSDYRRYVIAILPQISNLDFSPVIDTERMRPLPTGFFKTLQVK